MASECLRMAIHPYYSQAHARTHVSFSTPGTLNDLYSNSATHSHGHAQLVIMLNCSTLETSDPSILLCDPTTTCPSTFPTPTPPVLWGCQDLQFVPLSLSQSLSVPSSSLLYLVCHGQFQCLSTLKSLTACPLTETTTVHAQTWIKFTINYWAEAGWCHVHHSFGIKIFIAGQAHASQDAGLSGQNYE